MHWSAATQQHLTAPTVHAGLAAYDFSSNLPSDFEVKLTFFPSLKLTTLNLGDFNFHFNERLSSASH